MRDKLGIPALLVALFLLLQGVAAFWRMDCPRPLGIARIDPLVAHGKDSEHAHAIYGSNGISMTSGYDELRAGECTGCRVTEDKSGYWTPQLYFQDDETHEYIEVPAYTLLAYYKLNHKNITAYPPGFQMIAGENRRRVFHSGNPFEPDPPKSDWAALNLTYQEALAERAIGFNCLHNNSFPEEGTLTRHYLPEKSWIDEKCKGSLRIELMFPSCWKGMPHLDSDNHRDHVAYPDLVEEGNCPDSFPVKLVGLMYETFYRTEYFRERKGRYVLGNGDSQGFGYHGDFMSGWDEKFLQQAIQTCTNLTGNLEDCGLFQPHLVSQEDASKCHLKVPEMIANENVMGPIPVLPGNVPMKYADGDHGPVVFLPAHSENAVVAVGPIPTSAAVVAIATIPTSTDAISQAQSPATTPTPEVSAKDEGIFSTQFVTATNLVSKIVWKSEIVFATVTHEYTTTVTVRPSPRLHERLASKRASTHAGHARRVHFRLFPR